MSKLDKLINLRRKYSGWDGAVEKLLGKEYYRSPAFRQHVFAFNSGPHPESLADGYNRYVLGDGLCLD